MTSVDILQDSKWKSALPISSLIGIQWWSPLDLRIHQNTQFAASFLLGEESDVTREPRTSEVTQDCKDLQRVYMNEWVWISNVGQKQPAQPNFFSLVLFIQPEGFSDDLRGLPSWVSVHFTTSPIWQNGFYCKHFGSVAPAACCFSWPSGCLQIMCKLPFPQHTRDAADAQTT